MAWGGNTNGQLGNGTTTSSDVAGAVSGLSGVEAVSAGSGFSLALLGDGSVRAWGMDEFGELGDNSKCAAGADCHSDVPVAVSELSGVTAISAGSQQGLALLSNHTVRAWGWARDGALGDGSTETAFVPVPVFGLREVAGISTGGGSSIAYGPPIPTITNATPLEGPEGGGTQVAITGINFAEVTEVDFGPTPAANFEVTSPTSIIAVTPAGTGAQNVQVGNAGGADTFPTFRYRPVPVVTRRAGGKGPVTGGTTVRISGTNLAFTSSVKFGSINATSFTVATVKGVPAITAVAPAQAAGIVNIAVTTPGGTSAPSKATTFKYVPTVTGLSQTSGSKSGGTTVMVTGAGFALGTTATGFKFGTTKATSVSCLSTTECSVVAPAHAVGTVDVKAVVSKANSAKNAPADRFTYG